MSIVLDCGALIALERNDRPMWKELERSASQEIDVLVPAAALAQAWRGGAPQAYLARALRFCVVAPFDPLVRAIGELCGRTRTKDVCDAHVALVAADCDVLFTSDPVDLERLLVALARRRPKIVRC